MTNVQTVYDFLQEKAPFELQLGFDNAGFLVGRRDAAVSRILVSLDITEPVIQEAVERKAQLIVSHHPVIWGGAKSVTDQTPTGRKLLALAENHIAAICAHTNLDTVAESMTLWPVAWGCRTSPSSSRTAWTGGADPMASAGWEGWRNSP